MNVFGAYILFIYENQKQLQNFDFIPKYFTSTVDIKEVIFGKIRRLIHGFLNCMAANVVKKIYISKSRTFGTYYYKTLVIDKTEY